MFSTSFKSQSCEWMVLLKTTTRNSFAVPLTSFVCNQCIIKAGLWLIYYQCQIKIRFFFDQSLTQRPWILHQWSVLIVFIKAWLQRNWTGCSCCELSTPPHPLPPSVCFPSSSRSPWWVSSFCWASTSPPWLPAWAAYTEHPGSSSASPKRGSSRLWLSWEEGWVDELDGAIKGGMSWLWLHTEKY